MGSADSKIKSALDYLAFALGKSYNIRVLIGRVSQELWSGYEKQGSNVDEVNAIREKFGLYKLNQATNIKIVKRSWGKNIINGNGCVIVIQKAAYKYFENVQIAAAFEWLTSKFPDIKMDKVSTKTYDVFYVGYKFKEVREEEPKPVLKEEVIEIPQEVIKQEGDETAL